MPRDDDDVTVKTAVVSAAFELVAKEFNGDSLNLDRLSNLLYEFTIHRSSILSVKEMLLLASELIKSGYDCFGSTLEKWFTENSLAWNLNSAELNNPYNFLPILMKILYDSKDNWRKMQVMNIIRIIGQQLEG